MAARMVHLSNNPNLLCDWPDGGDDLDGHASGHPSQWVDVMLGVEAISRSWHTHRTATGQGRR